MYCKIMPNNWQGDGKIHKLKDLKNLLKLIYDKNTPKSVQVWKGLNQSITVCLHKPVPHHTLHCLSMCSARTQNVSEDASCLNSLKCNP